MKFLVLDVGGQAIKYAIMNEKAEFIEKSETPTPLDTLEHFVDTIVEIFNKHKDTISGIAMSMPGRIDSSKGYLYTGGALQYNDNTEMRNLLSKRCPVPIAIENDGKCAALAEAWVGNLKDYDDGIVVVLGTGIGGGIIKDKKLHKGKHFIAGEFSFIFTNNPLLPGRTNQCLADDCGTCGLTIPFATAKNLPIDNIDGRKFFEYANKGDKEALQTLDDYCHKLALQLYNLQHIYDPEKFAIGGGISRQDILFEYLEKNIEKCSTEIMYMLKPEIVRCKFFNDSNLIGALYNYITSFPN